MKSQDPDQQRNLLLAVVLSMAVLLGWQLFYAGPKMKEEQARHRAQQELTQQQTRRCQGCRRADDARRSRSGHAVPGTAAPTAGMSREDAVKISPRLEVDTPSLKGSIALRGGRIDDLVLVKYHETVDPKSPNVVLFSPADSPHPYFAEYGWVRCGRLDCEGARPRYAVAVAGERPADAGSACYAHLGQRPGRRLQAHDLGRRRLHVQARRRGREPLAGGNLADAVCARASLRHAEDRGQLDPARGPDRRHRRAGRAAQQVRHGARGAPADVRNRDRRLARLHRQVLGGDRRPRSDGALPGRRSRRRRRSCRASSRRIRPTTCATPSRWRRARPAASTRSCSPAPSR